MRLFRAVCWALLFILPLRFLPSSSITTMLGSWFKDQHMTISVMTSNPGPFFRILIVNFGRTLLVLYSQALGTFHVIELREFQCSNEKAIVSILHERRMRTNPEYVTFIFLKF